MMMMMMQIMQTHKNISIAELNIQPVQMSWVKWTSQSDPEKKHFIWELLRRLDVLE